MTTLSSCRLRSARLSPSPIGRGAGVRVGQRAALVRGRVFMGFTSMHQAAIHIRTLIRRCPVYTNGRVGWGWCCWAVRFVVSPSTHPPPGLPLEGGGEKRRPDVFARSKRARNEALPFKGVKRRVCERFARAPLNARSRMRRAGLPSEAWMAEPGNVRWGWCYERRSFLAITGTAGGEGNLEA